MSILKRDTSLAKLSSNLEGSFLARQENILAFGNPGSGKASAVRPRSGACLPGPACVVQAVQPARSRAAPGQAGVVAASALEASLKVRGLDH